MVCDEGGCFESSDGATCGCEPGYEAGVGGCVDVDECSAGTDSCDDNADCLNVSGTYDCECDSGFAGNGFTCSDINECATGTDSCAAVASCPKTIGRYNCSCPSGYTGNSFTCTDINECTPGVAGCDTNATCANSRGSFSCACDLGYSGNGFICSAVTSYTFDFPTSSDSLTGAGPGRRISAAGDFYTGSRAIPMAQVGSICGAAINLADNSICSSGGSFPLRLAVMAIRINDVQFGSILFGIPDEGTFFPIVDPPPAIVYPVYTITMEAFIPICGSYVVSETASTITANFAPTP